MRQITEEDMEEWRLYLETRKTMKQLRKNFGCSESTVYRYLKLLEAHGFIVSSIKVAGRRYWKI